MSHLDAEDRDGVSVITCTNRPEFVENVLSNYQQQDLQAKELIVVAHGIRHGLDRYRDRAHGCGAVTIIPLPRKMTLGACLNYAVDHAKYDLVAKFDDDDYYAPAYLSYSIKAFDRTTADVIGKLGTYVYFRTSRILAIRKPIWENRYVDQVGGPTLIIRKRVFAAVRFADVTLGEDLRFCIACHENGIRIYSTDRYHHVTIRYGARHRHTWRIPDADLLQQYQVIGEFDDFRSYPGLVPPG
jgi:cellulose synthase/poly-beta-1,6-N-acetylglucosamine synthase-like glycosyltransferase